MFLNIPSSTTMRFCPERTLFANLAAIRVFATEGARKEGPSPHLALIPSPPSAAALPPTICSQSPLILPCPFPPSFLLLISRCPLELVTENTNFSLLHLSLISTSARHKVPVLKSTSFYAHSSLYSASHSWLTGARRQSNDWMSQTAKERPQEAIRHGRRENANPGRQGELRLRYIHKGEVFLTDREGNKFVSAWNLNGEEEEEVALLDSAAIHTVIVVDHS
eukprot:426496-Hanusia_phi.AAC.2